MAKLAYGRYDTGGDVTTGPRQPLYNVTLNAGPVPYESLSSFLRATILAKYTFDNGTGLRRKSSGLTLAMSVQRLHCSACSTATPPRPGYHTSPAPARQSVRSAPRQRSVHRYRIHSAPCCEAFICPAAGTPDGRTLHALYCACGRSGADRKVVCSQGARQSDRKAVRQKSKSLTECAWLSFRLSRTPCCAMRDKRTRHQLPIRGDVDQCAARAARKRMFDKFAQDLNLIVGMHLPYPGTGPIERDGAQHANSPI